MAIATRVSNLEAQIVDLRQKVDEREIDVRNLEGKASRFERDWREADSRFKIVLDDNMNLKRKRDSIAMTVNNLSRDITKLEKFKRQLIQSLSDENSPKTDVVDNRTCNQSVPWSCTESGIVSQCSVSNEFSYHMNDLSCFSTEYFTMFIYTNQKKRIMRMQLFYHSYSPSADMTHPVDEALKYTRPRFSLTPYLSPWLTPNRTPKITSTNVSPRSYSGAISPTKTRHKDQNTTLWYPSSQQSSAANSPPRARPLPASTPRIDAKEFYRQARTDYHTNN